MSSASESLPATPLPEAGHDPGDPNQPLYQDHDPPSAPIANPTADMDGDVSDNDSILSEVDEAQFEDFDPANVAIDDRPQIAVDEDTVKLLGRHKRKRPADGDVDGEGGKRKKKEGKRDKPKKLRKKRDEDDNFSGGEELEGKRVRKKKEGGERREKARPRKATPENEEALDPETRRRRALDRAMDEALRNPNKRRRKMDGIDLEGAADAEIEDVSRRMAEAAEADTNARKAKPPKAAMHKLKMLPEVISLLNRNHLQQTLVDPECSILRSVRFFLEPLDDGSLPAYNIQRDMFAILAKLPIGKEALIASGIGKVTLFYTKSKRPELGIKRQAEKLLGEWTRPILKRSDDYRQREYVHAEYDPTYAFILRTAPILNHVLSISTDVKLSKIPIRASARPSTQAETAAEARERALAPPVRNANRARIQSGPTSYSIVPRNAPISQSQFARPLGASGEDAFRRMKARQMGKAGGERKR